MTGGGLAVEVRGEGAETAGGGGAAPGRHRHAGRVRRDGRPAAGDRAALHERDPARARARLVGGRRGVRDAGRPGPGRRRRGPAAGRGRAPARRGPRRAPGQRGGVPGGRADRGLAAGGAGAGGAFHGSSGEPGADVVRGASGERGGVGLLRLDVLAVDHAPWPAWRRPRMATHEARHALPASVPHADAAANAARSALLLAALTSDPAVLFDATEDFLHQRYRAAAMPQTADLLGQAAPRRGRGGGVRGRAQRRWPSAWRMASLGLRVVDSIACGNGYRLACNPPRGRPAGRHRPARRDGRSSPEAARQG